MNVTMSENKLILSVENQEELRVDKFLSEAQSELSRSYIQKLIKNEYVTVNQQIVKTNYTVSHGDEITIRIPEPISLNIEPENILLDILFEDEDIIVINKPKNMVLHPAPGHNSGTLVNALLYHCKGNLSGINGILRPGIVHRIDKDTTGVIVACKNDNSHKSIAQQLKVHSITRRYHTIVFHSFPIESGKIEGDIGRNPNDRKKMAVGVKNGKPAVTYFKVLNSLNQKFSYIECTLETGRTHQIRVHMASIHHPILGDLVYGPSKQPYSLQGQTLHASVLGFIHPKKKQYVEFHAPLPEYFKTLLSKLNS